MKIMIDTNILVAALVFKSDFLAKLIQKIIDNHKLIICSYVIDELYSVVRRKNPDKEQALINVINKLKFECIKSPDEIDEKDRLFKIRDEKDYIILHTAIIENVDIFITNDKDFSDIDIKRPKIMKPEEFDKEY